MDAVPEIVFAAVVLTLVVAGYWSLVVLPKQQAFRKHQHYVRQLQVGDEVVTYGGLIGTITTLEPDKGVASLCLAEDLEVRIITAALIQAYDPDTLMVNAQIGTPRNAQNNAPGSEV